MDLALTEAYRDWKAPSWVRPLVAELLDSIDDRYLRGLGAVILTNAGALTHDRKRTKTWARGRKVPLSRCRGLYHASTRQQGAWVEVFVDQVLISMGPLRFVPLTREILLAKTLFHEIGHHIHATQVPEHRDRETVADGWRRRLGHQSFCARHPRVRSTLRPLRPVGKAIIRLLRSLAAR